MNIADSRKSQRIFWWGLPRKLSERFNPLTHPGLNTLTRNGRRQARRAGMVLAGVVESPVMASSTEVRARQTAEIVSREVGVEEYRLEHFLRERARDYFTGSHMEREVDALNRFRYGLDELLEQNDGSLIVVSHYHVLRMYLGKSLENGGVVHAQYRDGEVRVRGYLGRE